jgi:hypothetical protein
MERIVEIHLNVSVLRRAEQHRKEEEKQSHGILPENNYRPGCLGLIPAWRVREKSVRTIRAGAESSDAAVIGAKEAGLPACPLSTRILFKISARFWGFAGITFVESEMRRN